MSYTFMQSDRIGTVLDRAAKHVGAEPASLQLALQGETLRRDQGLNSIEFQQDVQQGFQQRTLHSVVLNTLLKITLSRLLKFK